MTWPLMRNNVTRQDMADVRYFLGQVDGEVPPRLTQGNQVVAFEREFAQWLGCKYAVMVNSGSSANLITMAALRERTHGPGEVIVPTICWVSDIAAVIHAGFKPVFVDIDRRTLGMDFHEVFKKITKNTKAVFVTHVLGFNAFTQEAIAERLAAMHIDLIEDCCEATGARMGTGALDKKLGTLGLASNFSFYYAHHMSTVEGGMVCTDEPHLYQMLRQFRSHGLVRERNDEHIRRDLERVREDLDPQFIFSYPAYNVRSTEINAVIGRSQLKRLDENNDRRTSNLQNWLGWLSEGDHYFTDYRWEGASNYALPLVLKNANPALMDSVIELLVDEGVEYRRGTAGGGNQLRQPYARMRFGNDAHLDYPNTEHVHFYGLYIGNYPDLQTRQIESLCAKLNAL